MLVPLCSICVVSLLSIFMPWIKALQEPSIALLHSASTASRDCFKEFGEWLQLSTRDTGHRPSSPLSSPPLIVYLPTPTGSSSVLPQSWNGTNDYILLSTVSSLATVTQSEKSLSLVTPFKVHPAHFPPPLPLAKRGSVVNDTGEIFTEELIISNEGLPLFLGLVGSILVSFHLVVYVSWKREMAKMRKAAEEKMIPKPMEDLSKAKIVLDKEKDSYLGEVLDGLDTISKEPETSSEANISIVRDSSSAPKKPIPVKWGTVRKSESESTCGGALPRAPAVDPSAVVLQPPFEAKTKSHSDISNQRVRGPAVANDARPALRQSDNGGRPVNIQATTRRPSTTGSQPETSIVAGRTHCTGRWL
ncbi:hypothetical protein TMatcc_000633 [Talaromyces marneffei ATCC 18224]